MRSLFKWGILFQLTLYSWLQPTKQPYWFTKIDSIFVFSLCRNAQRQVSQLQNKFPPKWHKTASIKLAIIDFYAILFVNLISAGSLCCVRGKNTHKRQKAVQCSCDWLNTTKSITIILLIAKSFTSCYNIFCSLCSTTIENTWAGSML